MTLEQEFAQFWKSYPRRIARLEAQKAFMQARRVASFEQILDGVERYLGHLPEEACFIPYPASWLRAGRYDDEYEVLRPAARPRWECPHTPACQSKVWCACLLDKERESA